MVQWLLSATGWRLATLLALAALMACASTAGEPQAEATAVDWRVVERVGEARHLPPGYGSWRATITGQPISQGSEVTTGRGGRLIIARPGRHISVGPASRFVLPHPDWDDRLEQRAGWLRYRVEATEAAPFRVHTPSLDIEFIEAVLDVRVEQGEIDITVAEGKVRLATPDGLRRTEVAAGQSAHASGPGGTRLAVQSAPHEGFESIEPLIIPAIRPKPETTVAPQIERPATVVEPAETSAEKPEDPDRTVSEAPREPEATGPAPAGKAPQAYRLVPPAERSDATAAPAAPALSGERAPSMQPALAEPATTGVDRPVAPAVPETGRRAQFQRLSEGMLEGVQPAPVRVGPQRPIQ